MGTPLRTQVDSMTATTRLVKDTHPFVWFASGARRKLRPKARAVFDACEAGEVEIVW